MESKLKVMTTLGTRPEIIRLSYIIAKLDKLCDHVLVQSNTKTETVVHCARTVLALEKEWTALEEYLENNVSGLVVNILLGYLLFS